MFPCFNFLCLWLDQLFEGKKNEPREQSDWLECKTYALVNCWLQDKSLFILWPLLEAIKYSAKGKTKRSHESAYRQTAPPHRSRAHLSFLCSFTSQFCRANLMSFAVTGLP